MGTEAAKSEEEEMPLLRRSSRMGSMRRFMNSSIRRTRKVFGMEDEDKIPETSEAQPRTLRDHQIHAFNMNETVHLSRISIRHYKVMRTYADDKIFTSIKPIIPPATCPLIKYFPREGKGHDVKSTLNSFERKRRSHHIFGVDHHAKEQLFCPLQASQIEFGFRTQIKTDIVIKVQAPNGEVSGYINPDTTVYTTYTPSNIGCGHGQWLVHVARRRGCKFHHGSTKVLNLVGQGVLYFEVDINGNLKEVEKLWLDCLN